MPACKRLTQLQKGPGFLSQNAALNPAEQKVHLHGEKVNKTARKHFNRCSGF